jgi:hypothetical protein
MRRQIYLNQEKSIPFAVLAIVLTLFGVQTCDEVCCSIHVEDLVCPHMSNTRQTKAEGRRKGFGVILQKVDVTETFSWHQSYSVA